jgi:hypothetical protein
VISCDFGDAVRKQKEKSRLEKQLVSNKPGNAWHEPL